MSLYRGFDTGGSGASCFGFPEYVGLWRGIPFGEGSGGTELSKEEAQAVLGRTSELL